MSARRGVRCRRSLLNEERPPPAKPRLARRRRSRSLRARRHAGANEVCMLQETRLLGVCLAFSVSACAPIGAVDRASDAPVTAILGATVVHPQREGADAVERDRTIVIVGNRIRAVSAS